MKDNPPDDIALLLLTDEVHFDEFLQVIESQRGGTQFHPFLHIGNTDWLPYLQQMPIDLQSRSFGFVRTGERH